MRVFKIIVISAFLCVSVSSASALDLTSARKQGLVKELPTGFLKATDGKSAGLVKEINAKRKKAYSAIAKKTKISVDQVGKQAAGKIKAKLGKK